LPRFLTVREANFAVKFVETGEARAAAIKIGVSPASAAQVGYRMMKRSVFWTRSRGSGQSTTPTKGSSHGGL